VAIGLWAGVTAFLLTCIGGHPLLVPGVAASFAVALGVLSAVPEPEGKAAPEPHPPGLGFWLILPAALLVVSVPVRVGAQRASFDLEHAILGNGRWQAQAGGGSAARFRNSLAFYVRATGQPTTLELRSARRSRRPVDVTIRLDGRAINVVRLQGTDWRAVRIVVPARPDRPFRVLRLDADYAGSASRASPVVDVRRPTSAQ
jgi:hypothetical protein